MSEKKFQIAISYAHSNSEEHELMFISQVAEALKELEVKTFRSTDEQNRFFGKRVDRGFHDVFSHADFIVVFVSEGYAQEGSPILEMEKQIAFSPLSIATESVAVVAFDEQYVPPIYKSKLGFIHAREHLKNPKKLASIIGKRYKERMNDKHSINKSFFAQGYFNSLHGNYQQAVRDYSNAIKINKNDHFAHLNLGTMHLRLNQTDKAIESYNRAIQLKSDFVDAYYNRGYAKDGLAQHYEAIKDYDKAIQLRPDYAEAYNNCGVAKGNLNRLVESIKDFDEAIQLDPKHFGAYNNRGVALTKLGHLEEAIKDYGEAIRINPEIAKVFYNRGDVKSKLSRWNEAIKDYNKAIQLNPYYAEAYRKRGVAKKELGLLDEAVADMIKAEDLTNKRNNEDSGTN